MRNYALFVFVLLVSGVACGCKSTPTGSKPSRTDDNIAKYPYAFAEADSQGNISVSPEQFQLQLDRYAQEKHSLYRGMEFKKLATMIDIMTMDRSKDITEKEIISWLGKPDKVYMVTNEYNNMYVYKYKNSDLEDRFVYLSIRDSTLQKVSYGSVPPGKNK